jgi:hypothetical protein
MRFALLDLKITLQLRNLGSGDRHLADRLEARRRPRPLLGLLKPGEPLPISLAALPQPGKRRRDLRKKVGI